MCAAVKHHGFKKQTFRKPRPPTRRIVRWSTDLDLKLLLSIHHITSTHNIKLPWKQIADLVGDPVTDGAILQHLAKLRNRCEERGLDVPPKLPRGGNRRKGLTELGEEGSVQRVSRDVCEMLEKQEKDGQWDGRDLYAVWGDEKRDEMDKGGNDVDDDEEDDDTSTPSTPSPMPTSTKSTSHASNGFSHDASDKNSSPETPDYSRVQHHAHAGKWLPNGTLYASSQAYLTPPPSGDPTRLATASSQGLFPDIYSPLSAAFPFSSSPSSTFSAGGDCTAGATANSVSYLGGNANDVNDAGLGLDFHFGAQQTTIVAFGAQCNQAQQNQEPFQFSPQAAFNFGNLDVLDIEAEGFEGISTGLDSGVNVSDLDLFNACSTDYNTNEERQGRVNYSDSHSDSGYESAGAATEGSAAVGIACDTNVAPFDEAFDSLPLVSDEKQDAPAADATTCFPTCPPSPPAVNLDDWDPTGFVDEMRLHEWDASNSNPIGIYNDINAGWTDWAWQWGLMDGSASNDIGVMTDDQSATASKKRKRDCFSADGETEVQRASKAVKTGGTPTISPALLSLGTSMAMETFTAAPETGFTQAQCTAPEFSMPEFGGAQSSLNDALLMGFEHDEGMVSPFGTRYI